MTSKTQIWKLTINYFPRAAAAGVDPIPVEWGILLRKQNEGNPAFYRPHEFFFQNPPTREDFINSLHGYVWAQHAWGDSLLPLIKDRRNQWPIINDWYKSGQTYLTTKDEVRVARIDLDRVDMTVNPAYFTLGVAVRERDAFINRRVFHKKREQARKVVDDNENRIRERVMELVLEQSGWGSGVYLATAIEEVLITAGIIKPVKAKTRRKAREAA